MKLSIFGTSEIINHHIKAAKKNSFEIFSICTSNKNSKNIKKLSLKYKIKNIYYNWKDFVKNSHKNNCNILIAGRIKDNKKILKMCVRNNLKVIIEKPVFTSTKEFNEFLNFRKNIFVAYNRIYYHNIASLKKNLSKESLNNVYIKCPEINKKSIELNTCHIISIIYELFGKIKLTNKIINKKSIFCIFETKQKNSIYLNINFGVSDNFSFEFNFEKKRIKLEPIEKLIVYNKLIKKKYKKINFYTPNISKISSEFKQTKLKPGFELQYFNFKKFLKNKKSNFININDAKEIISLCNKISS